MAGMAEGHIEGWSESMAEPETPLGDLKPLFESLKLLRARRGKGFPQRG